MLTPRLKLLFRGPRIIPLKRSMSDSSTILGELHNRVGVLSLNRPKALNSLDYDMVSQIQAILRGWTSKSSLDSLIIDSTNPKAFCAGGDIVSVTTKTNNHPDPAVFFQLEYEMDYFLSQLSIPVTSLIHGIVMGGGVGLSVHGRYRVATEKTMFAMPEVSIGLFPDVGGSWFLPRLQGKLGWYLGMTGHRVKGSDVYHAGIATHMCPAESLPQLKKDLLAAPSNDIDSILSSYHKKFPLHPFSFSEETLHKIDSIFGEARSGVDLMRRLQGSGDPFAEQMLSTLRKGSPTSIAVTFKLLQEGQAASSMGECLNMEYNIVGEIMKRKDFYEGVRALLIDKDLSPKWSPASIEEIDEKYIQEFFKKDRKLNLT